MASAVAGCSSKRDNKNSCQSEVLETHSPKLIHSHFGAAGVGRGEGGNGML